MLGGAVSSSSDPSSPPSAEEQCTKLSSFMRSPLVTWVQTFQDEDESNRHAAVELFKKFCDGTFLHEVWLKIDGKPCFPSVSQTVNDCVTRTRNLSYILGNIRVFYEEMLGQLLVLRMPDVIKVAKIASKFQEQELRLRVNNGRGAAGLQGPAKDLDEQLLGVIDERTLAEVVKEVSTMLLLILGAAVQCNEKQHFIEGIKQLDVAVQHSIVEHIQMITDNPDSVWLVSDWAELANFSPSEQEVMYRQLVKHVQNLVKERDALFERAIDLTCELAHAQRLTSDQCQCTAAQVSLREGDCNGGLLSQTTGPDDREEDCAESDHYSHNYHHTCHMAGAHNHLASTPGTHHNHSVNCYHHHHHPQQALQRTNSNTSYHQDVQSKSHLLVEIAEVKSKLRRVQQELEEKNELVAELRDLLDQNKEACSKLRQENLELSQDARSLKAYRDEIDILKERVRKVDRLENEVQRYRDKMNEIDFYKSRIEELREDNRILAETKSMLEEQLEVSRGRGDRLHSIEAELLKLQVAHQELQCEKEEDQQRIKMLMDQVTQLTLDKKIAIEELNQVQGELNQLRCQVAAECYSSSDNIRGGRGEADGACGPGNQSGAENLLEQINNDAAKRVLKLELENQKLQTMIENMQQEALINVNLGPSKPRNQRTTSGTENASTSDPESGFSPNDEMDDDETAGSTKSLSGSTTSLSVQKIGSQLHCLQKENEALKSTIDLLQGQQRDSVQEITGLRSKLRDERERCEALERQLNSLNQEQTKLTKVHENLLKKCNEQEVGIQGLDAENAKLRETCESLKSAVSRLNAIEKETTNLEAENHRLEHEKKSVDKELSRLRATLETKEQTIDQLMQKVQQLEMDKKHAISELDSATVDATKLKELELTVKELTAQAMINKETVESLRKELVEEKIKGQQRLNELERISAAFESLDPLILQFNTSSGADTSSSSHELSNDNHHQSVENVSENWSERRNWNKVLEELIDRRTSQMRREKDQCIEQLKLQLNDLTNRANDLKGTIKALKERIESSDEEKNTTEYHKVLCKELQTKLDQLEEEKEHWREESKDLKDINGSLAIDVQCLEQRLRNAEFEKEALQTSKCQLQVENTELQSKITSLESQTRSLQNQLAAHDETRQQHEQDCGKLQQSYRDLMDDHESLQKLHQQLTADYDLLSSSCQTLKIAHKNLRQEHKSLQDRLQQWIVSQDELQKLASEVNHEGCRSDREKSLEQQLADQTVEYKRLQTEYKFLQNIYRQLRAENNELKLKYTELQGETAECRERMAKLDFEVAKLGSYCETMALTNTSLEEQRKTLIRNVSNLVSQYHDLLAEIASDSELAVMDRMQELCAKRERVERMLREFDLIAENKLKKKTIIRTTGSSCSIASTTSTLKPNNYSNNDSNLNGNNGNSCQQQLTINTANKRSGIVIADQTTDSVDVYYGRLWEGSTGSASSSTISLSTSHSGAPIGSSASTSSPSITPVSPNSGILRPFRSQASSRGVPIETLDLHHEQKHSTVVNLDGTQAHCECNPVQQLSSQGPTPPPRAPKHRTVTTTTNVENRLTINLMTTSPGGPTPRSPCGSPNDAHPPHPPQRASLRSPTSPSSNGMSYGNFVRGAFQSKTINYGCILRRKQTTNGGPHFIRANNNYPTVGHNSYNSNHQYNGNCIGGSQYAGSCAGSTVSSARVSRPQTIHAVESSSTTILMNENSNLPSTDCEQQRDSSISSPNNNHPDSMDSVELIAPPTTTGVNETQNKRNSTSSIWYEYGCV